MEAEKKELGDAVATMKDEHLSNISKQEKVKRQMKDLEKEMEETTLQELELKKEMLKVEEDVLELRKLGKPDTKDTKNHQDDEDLPDEEKRAKRQVLKLRSQIQVERSTKELLDLRVAELDMQIEEVNEELEEAADPAFFDDATQIAWHKEALKRFLQDHQNQMKRLRLEQGELKLKKRQAEDVDKEVDVEALKKNLETKKSQYEAVLSECKNTDGIIAERTEIRKANDAMAEASTELEQLLFQEIDTQKRQFAALEGYVKLCLKKREEYQKRHREADAAVARLEIRLQTVKSQKDSFNMTTDEKPVLPLGAEEIDSIKAGSAAQGGMARAVAWALTLSSSVKEEAGIGQSFTCLMALHRVFQKAQILTNSIHQHYVADASLAVLQSNAPVEWLCRACLAAAIISYSGAGVLGRLHGASPEKYKRAISSPALKSCANGEKALDAVISVVLDALMDSLGPKGPPAEALTTLRALGAQLLSAEKSTFKDEPFASWQSASCAVEACRAACALALYASADAGGTRREQWQQLFGKADQIRKSVGRLGGQRTTCFDIELNMLAVSEPDEKAEANTSVEQAEDGAPATEAAPTPADAPAETPAAPSNSGAQQDPDARTLDQTVLDALLLQVKVLEANAEEEPKQEEAADELDRALQQCQKQLDEIQKAGRALEKRRKAGVPDSVQKISEKPWMLAREKARKEIAHADANSVVEKQAAEENTKNIIKSIAEVEDKITKAKKNMEDVERDYGRARVESERFAALKEQVERLKRDTEKHTGVRDDLTKELHSEQDKKRTIEAEATEKRTKCRELQTKLEEVEVRLKKKFNTGMTPEEVIALRHADTRQQRELMDLHWRCVSNRERPKPGVNLPRPAGSEDIMALCEKGRQARSAAAVEQKRGQDTQSEITEANTEAGETSKPRLIERTSTEILELEKKEDKKLAIKESLLTSIVTQQDDELSAIWQTLQKAQSGLLMDQASSSIINLQEENAKGMLEAQYLKQDSAMFECSNLKDAVSRLLHKTAGVAEHRDGGAHGSVAFSRFLRSNAQSAQHGPVMKVKVPLTLGAQIAGISNPGAIRSLATADEIHKVHRGFV